MKVMISLLTPFLFLLGITIGLWSYYFYNTRRYEIKMKDVKIYAITFTFYTNTFGLIIFIVSIMEGAK